LLATPLASDVWRWLGRRYSDRPLSLDTSPQLDLAIDSLGWVALTVDLERELGVTLRAERLAGILTLRDLLREIEAAATGRSAAPRAEPAFAKPGPALRALGAVLLAAARSSTRLLWRPAVAGVEQLPSGPALIAPNHASYLDPLVIAAALPWRRLRRTYWAGWAGIMHSTPLRRLASRALQVFPVDADRDLAAAVRIARELLGEGYSIVWFPEGRRSPDGRLQEFQPGVGVLLEGAEASVVPVAITGTFAAWPRQNRWPKRAPIAVRFGAPLDSGRGLEAAALRQRIERAVRQLLGSADVTEASPRAAHEERPHVDRRSH
jgi:long-chain acyl-CoA synthetase